KIAVALFFLIILPGHCPNIKFKNPMIQHPLRTHIEELVVLTDQEFAFVLEHFQPRIFKKHQIVLHQGDSANHEYFVVKGLMKVSRPDPDGKEHILQFAMENWWITDAEAFYNHNPSKLVIDCMEDTHTLAITLAHKEKISRIGRAACRESAYKSLVSQCVRTR